MYACVPVVPGTESRLIDYLIKLKKLELLNEMMNQWMNETMNDVRKTEIKPF